MIRTIRRGDKESSMPQLKEWESLRWNRFAAGGFWRMASLLVGYDAHGIAPSSRLALRQNPLRLDRWRVEIKGIEGPELGQHPKEICGELIAQSGFGIELPPCRVTRV